MKYLLLSLLCFASIGRADETPTNVSAAVVMQHLLAHRATKDFSLKARLFPERDRSVEVEMLVHNSVTETRTIYREGQTELLIVQPVTGGVRWFLRGTGELTGTNRLAKLAGSQFTLYDLGAPFLRWPDGKVVELGRVRGRDCHVVEIPGVAGEPYSKVKLWVDREFSALVRAELYDLDEGLARRMGITSFKRLGELWIPRVIEVGFVTPHQALPSEEKSRLEIYEGDYATRLPAELFEEVKFLNDHH